MSDGESATAPLWDALVHGARPVVREPPMEAFAGAPRDCNRPCAREGGEWRASAQQRPAIMRVRVDSFLEEVK